MTIKITPEAVKERITALESSGEVSLKEQFYLEALRQLMAAVNSEPVADVVAWSHPTEERTCDVRLRHHDVEPGPLYRHSQQPVNSEPVGYLFHNEDGVVLYSISDDATEGFSPIGPIYSVPQPAPVVPEALERLRSIVADSKRLPRRKEWISGQQYSYVLLEEVEAIVDDVCRAAMLASAEHDTPALNSVQSVATVPGKWIPVSEQMPEDSGRYWCYVEEQNDLGKSHYQWNCSWNGDRWWVESEGGGIVTHWMPLPAAPQEVK